MSEKLKTDFFNTNRLLWHGDKIRQWQEGQNPYPINLDIHLTGACNLRCPRCAGGEREGSLDTQIVFDLLKELRKGDVRAIVYTGGGEPAMHKDFSKIIKYTKELGFSIGLITNGSLLTDEMMKTVVAYNDWVRVSLDGYDNGTYNRNYGVTGNTFEIVCGNIKRLVEIKKELGSGCIIGVGYLIDDNVIPGMVSVSERVKGYGVDYIQFRHFETYSSNSERSSMLENKNVVSFDVSKFYQNVNKCLALADSKFRVAYNKEKFQGIAEAFCRLLDYNSCHGSQFTGIIASTGDVYICCVLVGDARFSFGKLGEKSFHEIWNGKQRKNVMNNLKIASDCVPFCRYDSMNSFLEPLSRKMLHVDFL